VSTIELTAAQAVVRYLAAQKAEIDGEEKPLFAGVFAIFGHGNVAGLGHALEENRIIHTFRAHNEQAMGHAAIAYAKATKRRQMMACTTSIGPGATNLVTAAATAHVNRLPVLFLPGDVFASRAPDPVLQQVECFGDATVTANDCLRPVSRYFDRIMRPEQLLIALPNAIRVLTDPADCGPVTLAFPQDVQTESYAFPASFFAPRVHRPRRPAPDSLELERAVSLLQEAKQPLIIAGGGVLYSDACEELARFAEKHAIPVAETQAGKGALPWLHPCSVGGIGVTGTAAANALAREADLVLAIGTRLQDFTTASRTLFEHPELRFVGLNACAFDAHKHSSVPLIADARAGLTALDRELGDRRPPASWMERARGLKEEWNRTIDAVTAPTDATPTDAQVLGAVNRACTENSAVVCAAGGLPGELHKLWRPSGPGSYHLEYGYSCMGYEIAGGLGVKMADPNRDVWVLVGDGSYLMLNSEIATSVAMRKKLGIVVLDNRGFGCINRLQKATGGAAFNNLLPEEAPQIDFVKHAESLGAIARRVRTIAELEQELLAVESNPITTVIVIETDPERSTSAGGAWWEVAVPEVSPREEARAAHRAFESMKKKQRGA
jgi:3D-(3,5/4)-trihydroxycyclohexane-1,2-dione acylhydrolase (decyclizing)